MRGSFKIGRIGKIEIGIHYTWLLALLLITFSQAQNFQNLVAGWSRAQYWVAGFLSALLLFVSVLLHELAHSFVAQARGLPVSSITLFIFGGVSNLSEEPERPGLEFWMAIVGPLTSLILGGLFWLVWFGLTNSWALPITSVHIAVGKQTMLALLVGYLAYINLALTAFNLLPGFPLDGGRVFRSIIWKATGNLVRATNIAALVGRIFGWGFIAVGAYLILFIQGGFLSGVWIAIIGVFLNSAAESGRQEASVREHLSGIKVAQVMEANTDTVSPRMAVAELVREIFLSKRRRSIPVAEGDQIVGMVSISDVRDLPQEQWNLTPVERIMTKSPVHTVTPEDDLNAAMKVIAQFDLNQVPVISQGKIVGILSRANIVNFLQLRAELGMRSGRAQQRPPEQVFRQ